MEAAIWSAIGLVVATSLGTLFYLDPRVDALSNRLDARSASIDARLDAMASRLDTHVERHAG